MTDPYLPPDHTYGPKRADKQRDCNPVCSPVLGVRVPDTLAGVKKHDAAHVTYGGAPPPPPGTVPTPRFPFDVAPATNGKLVVGHWMNSLPLSLDNRSALSVAAPGDYYDIGYGPGGEGGIHDPYYAFVFNRPAGRATRAGMTEDQWRQADARAEILDCLENGIDVVANNIMAIPPGTSWHPAAARALSRAAAEFPGSVMLELDVSGVGGWSDTHTREQQVSYFVELINTAGAGYRRVDGKVALAAYGCDRKPAAWFVELLNMMAAKVGPIHFMPVFLAVRAPNQPASVINPHVQTYIDAGIVGSYGEWGNASVLSNPPEATGYRRLSIAAAHAKGVGWFGPAAFTDYRPQQGIYDEACNTETLRRTWEIIIAGSDRDADAGHVRTLNDYVEGAAFARSHYTGDSILNLNAYYAQWFHTGRRPDIRRDGLYLTHRRQPHSGAALTSYPRQMALRPGSSPPRDTIEALVMLRTPGDVEILVNGVPVGGQQGCPAGIPFPVLAPLGLGQVSARISRGGLPELEVVSPFPAAARWPGRDLQYVASHRVQQAA